MNNSSEPKKADAVPEFLSGGGEMGQRIRDYRWENTVLGPVSGWPQSLRTCVRIMLTSRQPIWIGWGKDLIKLYNDPYKAIVGGKHPVALGCPASEVWKDIWRDIEPLLKTVMDQDEGTYVESQLLIMERNGYPEETYYTFSYTPIPGDDGGTAGMICANTEDTDRIISERQLKSLTELGKNLTDTKTNDEVIGNTINTLKANPKDFPFASFYSFHHDHAILTHSTYPFEALDKLGTEINLTSETDLAKLIKKATVTKQMQIWELPADIKTFLPTGAWEIPPDKIIILPISPGSGIESFGVLLFGINPYRLLDEKYTGFFSLVSDQVVTSISDVHLLEQERKRATQLAELDRAKTLFFSNISHEFRTPLTLLLGPVEETLRDPATIPENRKRMELAYRNVLRMQKLVNTLLEFSRIEAGRVEGKFSKTDICKYTRDLVSTFRSAVEKSGMQLIVDCTKISDEVYVDIEMWEKIVLNLISNAFKYSRDGKIVVRIFQQNKQVNLEVSDTGVGIPADQLDKIFDRFHRVGNVQGRSQEGTGIGLALVKELLKIHKGTISVTSELGKGSKFIVQIPVGKEHLPADKIVEDYRLNESRNIQQSFHMESMQWIGEDENERFNDEQDTGLQSTLSIRPELKTVLLADDNADMRQYVKKLLQTQFNVITAVDGEDAFKKIHDFTPDLLLTDVMMPKVDGFELLNRVRSDNKAKNTPVIFLSARAGEESKIEGLDAGADDYLVKPFSAKELIARVESNIKLAQSRIAAESMLRNVILQSPVAMVFLKGKNFEIEIFNEHAELLFGKRTDDTLGKTFGVVFPELSEHLGASLQESFENGKSLFTTEIETRLTQSSFEPLLYIDFAAEPFYSINNVVEGIIITASDVSGRVKSRRKIEESERRFRDVLLRSPSLFLILESEDMMIRFFNEPLLNSWGRKSDIIGKKLLDVLPELKDQPFPEVLNKVFTTGIPHTGKEEKAVLVKEGKLEEVYYNYHYQPMSPDSRTITGITVMATDITEQVLSRKKVEESREQLELALEAGDLAIFDCYPALDTITCTEKMYELFEFSPNEQLGLKALQDAVHEDDRERYLQTQLEAMSPEFKGKYENIVRIVAKRSGKIKWVRSKGRFIFDENQQMYRLTGVIQDITKEKLAQESIMESENRFRTLAETLPQLIWITDAKGEQTYVSQRWKEYTGMETSTGSWEKIIHPDDLSVINEKWKESLQTLRLYTVELRLKNANGDYRWFFGQGEPIVNQFGEVIKWVGSFTDIHDQKEIEKRLEELVNQRTRELQRSNEDLQQFAHVASHDLKEPVRKIKTFIGRLEQEFSDILPEKGRTYIQKMERASERMYAMIEGVLKYSIINETTDNIELLDIDAIISDIEADLEVNISTKNATITREPIPAIEGFPVLIYQLFFNIFSNSLKFLKPGVPVRIDIKSERVNFKEEEFLKIVVSDNGIGFEQEFATRIFDTFTRLNSKDKYEGTGLGLALCKKIVERHNGFISAQGAKDVGAEFIILLPVKQHDNLYL